MQARIAAAKSMLKERVVRRVVHRSADPVANHQAARYRYAAAYRVAHYAAKPQGAVG